MRIRLIGIVQDGLLKNYALFILANSINLFSLSAEQFKRRLLN